MMGKWCLTIAGLQCAIVTQFHTSGRSLLNSGYNCGQYADTLGHQFWPVYFHQGFGVSMQHGSIRSFELHLLQFDLQFVCTFIYDVHNFVISSFLYFQIVLRFHF